MGDTARPLPIEKEPGYRARPAETEGYSLPPTRLRWRIGKMILWFIEGARLREAYDIERIADDVAQRERRLRRWQEKA